MSDPVTEVLSGRSPEHTPPRTGLRRAGSWICAHKIKTVLLCLAGLVLVELLTIPWFSIGSLKTENPGPTALMRQRLGEAEHSGKPLKIVQQWISIRRIPQHVIDAVVRSRGRDVF